MPDLYLAPRETEVPIDVKKVEEAYKATYMGDFCLRSKDGGWANQPVAIFYQENPPAIAKSNYFGLFLKGNELMITDGSGAFSEIRTGAVAKNGEVIYSAYRHDYRQSSDGTAIIDGALDYTKTNGCRLVGIRANKDKLEIIDDDRTDSGTETETP